MRYLAGIDLPNIDWGGLFDLNGKLDLPKLRLPDGGIDLDFLGGLGFPNIDLGGITLPTFDFGGLDIPCVPIPFIINCGGGNGGLNLELPKFDLGNALDFLGLLGQVINQTFS